MQSAIAEVQPTQMPFGPSGLHMGVLGSRSAHALGAVPGVVQGWHRPPPQMGVCHGQCGEVTQATQRPEAGSQRLPGRWSQSPSLLQRTQTPPMQSEAERGQSRSSAQLPR